ncbi:alpha/beta fold hydrolase [Peribacillus sp. SCS-26]|uniref:alpha/beta fold hydrolase n=1 Tax=Paraperibacillus marinus TaxID=3115295 RepID=UPI0039064A31
MVKIQGTTDYTLSKELFANGLYFEHYKNPSSTETIVLIHGFLSSAFSFRKLIPYLAEQYSIVTIDLPPFGKSGKSSSYIYSHENHARAIIELLEHLNLNRVILSGHSMGGQICLYVIKQAPHLASKAILLCSSGYLKKSGRALVLSSRLPFFHLYVKRWLAKSGVEKNLQNVVYNHALIDQEMVDGYMEPFLDDMIFKGLAKMIRDREGDLDSKDLQSIHIPCLLLWGEHDRVVPADVGRKLHEDLPCSTLTIFKDAGHLLPEEEPEKVFSAIQEFLG